LYLDFEGKYFADPAEMFPRSRGAPCRPKHIILLAASIDGRCDVRAAGHHFDLMLLHHSTGILESLPRHPGVELARESMVHGYPACRFRSNDRQALRAFYQEIWGKYERDILGVTVVEDTRPDFSREPAIRELPKSTAVFEILSHMINRSPDSIFFNESGGKASAQLLSIGRLMEEVRCYVVAPGRLSATGDLLAAL
jgi:hypothetical protein